MNPQEWWDEYGKSKYINFSLDGTSIKPTGSDLDKPQLWKQIHWRWYFANEESEEWVIMIVPALFVLNAKPESISNAAFMTIGKELYTVLTATTALSAG